MRKTITKSPPTLEQRVAELETKMNNKMLMHRDLDAVLAEMDQRISTLESMVLTLNKKHEEHVQENSCLNEILLSHIKSHQGRLDKLEGNHKALAEENRQINGLLGDITRELQVMDVRITRLRAEAKDGRMNEVDPCLHEWMDHVEKELYMAKSKLRILEPNMEASVRRLNDMDARITGPLAEAKDGRMNDVEQRLYGVENAVRSLGVTWDVGHVWTGKASCAWELDDDDMNTWRTECGQMHYFSEGGPSDNSHIYCPYCGRNLKEIKP